MTAGVCQMERRRLAAYDARAVPPEPCHQSRAASVWAASVCTSLVVVAEAWDAPVTGIRERLGRYLRKAEAGMLQTTRVSRAHQNWKVAASSLGAGW